MAGANSIAAVRIPHSNHHQPATSQENRLFVVDALFRSGLIYWDDLDVNDLEGTLEHAARLYAETVHGCAGSKYDLEVCRNVTEEFVDRLLDALAGKALPRI